jgi:hypothetical protein
MPQSTDPTWQVTYWLKGERLGSRQVRAKTEAGAKLAAQGAVQRNLRRLADKIEVLLVEGHVDEGEATGAKPRRKRANKGR